MQVRDRSLWGQPSVRRYRGKVAAGAYPTPRRDQGGGAAVASALAHLGVRLNQDFSLEWATGALADASTMLMSIKMRINGSSVGGTLDDNRGGLGKVVAGSNSQDGTHDAEHLRGGGLIIDNSAGNNGGGVMRSAVGDTNVLTNGGFLTAFAPILANIKNNEYFTLTMAVDTNHANTLKLGAFAIDGVQVNTFAEGGNWAAGQIMHSFGKLMLNVFSAAGAQGPADMDVARFYVDTPASMTGILDPTPGIGFTTGFLAKEFKPGVGSLDIGTDGSLWTGLSPKVFLEVRPGGVATDIMVNRSTAVGTLGNPTASAGSATTNTLLKAPYLATIHPQELTGEQPYMGWSQPVAYVQSSAPADTGTFTVDNLGQDVRVGDKICVWFASGGAGNRALLKAASTNGGNWTVLAQSTTGGDFAIWGRTATLADVTAQGQTWNAATKPVVTWTAGAGFSGGGSNATIGAFLIRKRSGNPITVTAAAPVNQTFAVGTPPLAPAITPPAATPGLLMDFLKAYGWQYEGNLSALPAGMIPSWKRGGDFGGGAGLGGSWPYMFEQRVNTAAQIAARSYTQSAYGNNAGIIFSMVFT